MKRFLIALVLLAVLCAAGCGTETQDPAASGQNPIADRTQGDPAPSDASLPEEGIPQELPGVWSSADAGKLMMSETITFGEDGDLTVTGTYQGGDMGTIYGTYRVVGNNIFCSITGGTTPYEVTYAFRIDGRTLVLTDDDGDATYLRTS